jgi:hypothetical protein
MIGNAMTPGRDVAMANRLGDVGPSQDPVLVFIMSRIQDANSRLAKLHEHGNATANRVFGSTSEAVSAGGKSPASDGLISMLNAVVDDLHGRITDCEGDMQRLQAL